MALRPCHMAMTCKINKLEKPGGPLGIFHALFGRSAAFYGHFRADAVTSEWSTHISSSYASCQMSELVTVAFKVTLKQIQSSILNYQTVTQALLNTPELKPLLHKRGVPSQLAITFSKVTIETLEQRVKYFQS